MIKAVIVEPTGESDTPIKFTAGLLLGISLDVEIYNLSDVSNVRVQVWEKLVIWTYFTIKLW